MAGKSVSQRILMGANFCCLPSLTIRLHCVYLTSSQPCSQPHRVYNTLTLCTGHPYYESPSLSGLSHTLFPASMFSLSFLDVPLAVPFKERRCGISVQVPLIKWECHCWLSRDTVKATRGGDRFITATE